MGPLAAGPVRVVVRLREVAARVVGSISAVVVALGVRGAVVQAGEGTVGSSHTSSNLRRREETRWGWVGRCAVVWGWVGCVGWGGIGMGLGGFGWGAGWGEVGWDLIGWLEVASS